MHKANLSIPQPGDSIELFRGIILSNRFDSDGKEDFPEINEVFSRIEKIKNVGITLLIIRLYEKDHRWQLFVRWPAGQMYPSDSGNTLEELDKLIKRINKDYASKSAFENKHNSGGISPQKGRRDRNHKDHREHRKNHAHGSSARRQNKLGIS